MADTEAEPLPVGLTADRALPKGDTVTDSVDEIWKGKETLVSQSHRVAPGPAPVELEPEEMSMHADSLDISDACGGLDAEDMNDGADDGFDPVIEEIKKSLSKLEKANQDKSSMSSLSSAGASEEDGFFMRISENFTSVPFGLQPRDVYEHGKKSTDIMGVTYNGRMRQFILLDSKGIVSWKRDAVDNRVTRSLSYPKYEYRLITYLVYARKYNCYFALWKDFSLKVLNRDFCETCSISADLRSVLFMLFNPIRDELITGGVEGTRVYHFHQAAGKVITELKPLANYQLTLRYELPNVGGSWVKKVELDYNLEHLYCCSDTDLYVYNLEGKQLFKFERAHNLSITGCRYSVAAKVLVTSSLDTEVKVWSMTGGLVHTFRGHSRAVTNLLIHPHNSTIVITCSLDGSLRMWSLDTMDALYSLVVSASGLLWMGLTDDNLLYISTARSLTLWHLNHFIHFWSLTRNQVTQLQLEGCRGKTQRVLAVGEDSSIRLFARSNQKNLSTVLPPPNVSPLQRILGVCYSREFNVIFVLINPKLIWVYTTRTDPACRIAVWDVLQIQTMRLKPETSAQERALLPGTKPGPSHRATENGAGNELPSSCLCVCILKSSAMVWTDEGCCCPVRHSYLLLGMEDGRVLFMDPVVKGHKYMEFKVTKDPVVGLHHDVDHQCLVTVAQMTQLTYVQYWTLPDLELIHEVFCAPDLTAYARIGYMCVTAHESGCVLFHTLEMASDPGLYKARMMPEPEDVIDMHHRPEHMAPVITVDACVPMKIFCSCSTDGAIKVWEECGALLTEIMLDDTLSAACFLNKSADLIVAFQKHIFFISHTKVCPHLKPLAPEDHTFDKESYVYEDPAVVYEGVVADPDPIDLESYLVPFEIEFSKDFLEGKVTLEPQVEETEDSDEEGRLSLAPTEIYLSPPSTPGSLSMVDLTLGSEVTKYDLLQQMKSTLQILIEKQKRRHMRRKGTIDVKDAIAASQQEADRLAEEQKHGADAGDMEERGTFQMNARRFEFPRFDRSPGPTPTLTPSSTPELVSEAELSEVEESDSEDQMKDQLPPKKIPDMQLVAAAEIKAKVDKGVSGAQKEDLPTPKRTRKAIGDMEIDVASLMKGSKQAVPAAKKEGDHSHAGRSSLETWEQEKSQRAPVKKKSVVQRKLPKRGLRPAEVHDGPKDVKDQPTVASAQGETHTSVHDAHEESKDDTTETISVKIKRVGSASSAKSTVESEGESKVQAEAPPLPSVPAPAERPPSSKSVRSMKSADVKKHPMEFLTNRTGAEVGVSPTAELESMPGTAGSAAASVADTAGLSRAGSPHAPSEWEDLNRTKSQMSWASSREGHGEGQYLAPEEDKPIPKDTDDVSHRPPIATPAPIQPVSPLKRNRIWSQDSDAILEEHDLQRAHGHDPERAQGHGLERAQGHDDGGLVSPRLPPPTPGVSPSPRQRFPSVTSSQNAVPSSATSCVDATGRESVVSGMGSPDSALPDGELAFTEQESPGGADEDEHRAWSRIGLPDSSLVDAGRPSTTLLPARHGQLAEGLMRQRPFTAAHTSFQTELGLLLELPSKAEELRAVFEAAYHRYQKVHGNVPGDGEKLYSNKGVNFEDKWQERVLERHMLLRMQRVLRAHAAQQRRQMLQQQRVKSAPQQKRDFSAGQQPQSRLSRPNTAHPSLLRNKTTTPAPAPTPTGSRPTTATGRSQVPTIEQQKQLSQGKRQQWQAQKDKKNLSEEQPFRLRIREPMGESPPQSPRQHRVRIDPWLLDPRNPSAVRPPSSKSIPSKCSRYVLLSRPRTVADVPAPTPLEEELLASRFPDQSVRLLKSAGAAVRLTPPHTSYGITYSPFSMYG